VGGARLQKSGTDLAIISWSKTMPLAFEAVDIVEAEGISASVLDLRWLSPLDE
jgi:pyruvate/2-oxoglutarate/acetoin dehydrogenase E1 component